MEKSSPSPSSPHQMAYLAELRKESSPAAIAFATPCPCCGNKKRRCLLPSPPPSRKKLLVLDLPAPATSPSPLPSPVSLTSPPSAVTQTSDFITRRASLVLQDSSRPHSATTSPSALAIHQQVIQGTGAFNWRCSDPTSPALQDSVALKAWHSVTTSSPVKKPAYVNALAAKKEPVEVIAPPVISEYGGRERSTSSVSSLAKPADCSAENDKRGQGEEEFRVGVKCKCGVVREFVLTR